MINAVIVDDEPKAIQILEWELSQLKSDIHVLKTFTKPEEALLFLTTNTPDCLFLDIQMPTMDGFQFLDRLTNRDFAIVITTAYDEYGIKALKHEAIDYLLKPIDGEDLESTIKKVTKFKSRQLNHNKLDELLLKINQPARNKKISLNTDGKLVFIDTDDILFVESDGNYSTFFLVDNQKMVVTKKLKAVDELLPDDIFFRIHNSYIINLNKIDAFLKAEGYVIMESKHKIPVARQRKSDFLDKI